MPRAPRRDFNFELLDIRSKLLNTSFDLLDIRFNVLDTRSNLLDISSEPKSPPRDLQRTNFHRIRCRSLRLAPYSSVFSGFGLLRVFLNNALNCLRTSSRPMLLPKALSSV